MFYFFPITLFAVNATCPLSSGINVHTKKRVLTICQNGSVVKRFKVALGYKGIGKKHAGDNKTPVGLYGLANAFDWQFSIGRQEGQEGGTAVHMLPQINAKGPYVNTGLPFFFRYNVIYDFQNGRLGFMPH